MSATVSRPRRVHAGPGVGAPARLVGPDLSYRPDVDGLRAIAVVAVVLFHGGIAFFDGGFVGVDVFFVISGYLITQRVVAAQERGSFSAWTFYGKRVRRLLPAAVSTTAASLAVGAALLSPQRFEDLAQSAVASSVSLSNVYFWATADYWNEGAQEAPLLHTWSLSVEEQFYLVWPALVLVLVARAGRAAGWWLLALSASSLAVTAAATAVSSSAAFYHMPFRAYEFGIGALCVWGDRIDWRTSALRRHAQAWLGLLGLAAIGASVLHFDESMAFPGAVALIPCVGAAAVIVSRRPPAVDRLLSNRPMRHVGLTSYSLYLVHWPVFVYLAEVRGELRSSDIVVALVATVVLAEVQYRLVERRFRIAGGAPSGQGVTGVRRWFGRTAAPVALASSVVVVAAGGVLASDGAPSRFPIEVRHLATEKTNDVMRERNAARLELCGANLLALCGQTDPNATNVVVLGDSHGADVLNALATAYPEHNFLIASLPRCPPLLGRAEHVPEDCRRARAEVFAELAVQREEIDGVVLASMATRRPGRMTDYVETAERLVRDGHRVVVFGIGARWESIVRDAVLRHGTPDGAEEALAKLHDDMVFDADEWLRTALRDTGAVHIDRLAFLCPDQRCRIFVPNSDELLVFDRSHLTLAGAIALGEWIRSSHPELFG